ncbi:MAG TPA: hypothetical protein VFQ39_07325 [Longimicrobium sp.]|nr:hypothetical protein [Longimicrobium sp.]
MSARYETVSHGRWPSGSDKPIAVLRGGPEELEHAYGLRFTPGKDDLDAFRAAGIRLASGRPVLLLRYQNSRESGTTLSIDREDDATAAFHDFKRAFEIPDGEFSWKSDEVIAGERSRAPGSVPGAVAAFVLGLISSLFASSPRPGRR